MRFLHIADTHLGAVPDRGMPWSEERSRALWDTFRAIIGIAGEQHVDLLLIAGDLFHRQPLRKECKEINALFAQIPDTRIVMIAGNRDYIRDTSPYLTYPWSANVTILTSGEMSSVYLEDLNTQIHGFSYHSPEICEARYDDLKAPSDGRIHILLGHGGDPRHIPVHSSRLMKAGFDYVALGHLHRPSLDERHSIVYPGSPEPTGKEDLSPGGYILGTITPAGVRCRLYTCASGRYECLTLTVNRHTTPDDVRSALKDAMDEDASTIYRIVLEGTRAPGIHFPASEFLPLGRISDVIDRTIPDYDLDRLKRDHQNDIISHYIDRLDTRSCAVITEKEEQRQRALFLGLSALLDPLG